MINDARHQVARRAFLKSTALAAFGAAYSIARPRANAAPPKWSDQLVRFPEKTDLILLTDRPPQLETPLKYFAHDFTPNDAFFVRWHLAGIPTAIDTRAFRLTIDGHVNRPLSLSLEDLRRQFEPVSLNAVAQCSGNSRSFFEPKIPGGQWANGALGNAKWTGVRLRDLLDRAAPKRDALDVCFQGLDKPVIPGTEPFAKSLDMQHACDGGVMVAYAMNGEDLPMLNGFPLRLIVPGWFATYWVKSLDHISVLDQKFRGFWMEKAYRIPANADASESPQALAQRTVPITRQCVRSLFVLPAASAKVAVGRSVEVQGVALDGGDGIKRVEVSTDAGATWTDATLDADLGRFAWRRWRFRWTPGARGAARLAVRATSNSGETQPVDGRWNRSGYRWNAIEQLDLTVT